MESDLQDPAGLGPWRSPAPPADFERFGADPAETSIGERFLAAASRHPTRQAVSSPSATWTYEELRTEVERLASGITRLVPRSEPTPVAVLATHDGPLVAAILATIVAGHVVVVVDPMAPRAEQLVVLGECRAPLLVHDGPHAAMAAELVDGATHHLNPVPLDDLHGDFDGPPARSPDSPAMLAFTSGTTGSSKAATITHGCLVNLLRGATDALGIGPADRMPMLFPVSLAVAAYPALLPLVNGGALATMDLRSEGLAGVGEFFERERITLAYLAPTVVRFLDGAMDGCTFPDLRMVALGGELVDRDAVEVTTRLFGPDLVAVGYGTTETGVVALYVFDPSEAPDGIIPVGYPVPDVEAVVLDDRGAALPDGEVGEIAVVSPYLFSGYWGHPELDRQVLDDDPEGRPGWRRYRTGDYGYLDPHGAIVVVGRTDTRVKIRGRFVVLGDVEADVRGLADVSDVAVASTRAEGIDQLVAYVVAAPGTTFDPIAARTELLADRAAYRVPSRWIVLDELPRLPNGKTDRRALPDPAAVLGATAPAGDGPAVVVDRDDAAAIREALRELWQRLLPVGPVGLDEDFFALGGDSLLAAQMLIEVEQLTGTTVPMGELVHARTVREVTEVVLRHRALRDGSTVACVQEGDEGARPRLWFVHDLQGSAYRVRHVAHHLGADQPVWSFESPLLHGERSPFRGLDTFAARYVTDLRAAQPEGPYWLAGYSFGGICAYEMARQLRADGMEVAFVGVVDVGPGYRGPGWHARKSPFRPWFGVAKPPEPGTPWRTQLGHYRSMAAGSPAGLARHLMVRSGLSRLVDPVRFELDLRRRGRVRPEWRLWYAWEEHWRLASRAWDRASTLDRPIDLFWADDTASADATMGWDPLVPEVHIHRYGGDHIGTLEPRGAADLAVSPRAAIDARRSTLRSG